MGPIALVFPSSVKVNHIFLGLRPLLCVRSVNNHSKLGHVLAAAIFKVELSVLFERTRCTNRTQLK